MTSSSIAATNKDHQYQSLPASVRRAAVLDSAFVKPALRSWPSISVGRLSGCIQRSFAARLSSPPARSRSAASPSQTLRPKDDARHARRERPRPPASAGRRAVRAECPRGGEGAAVVVASSSIHSTEIVASQMSLQLAYELASARDAETREILDNTILILIPSPNPDGIDIVADWYRRSLGKPWEGSEPPELYHAYAGHDDNREWFMLNLKETRAVTRLLWKEWFPQIVYDVHQQGSTGSRFFAPPFFAPPNPHIAPLPLREVGLIGHQ